MLSQRHKLMLIGITLILIIGMYTTVQPVMASVLLTLGVIMLGAFLAGVISGYLISKFFSTTVYESGVELGDYIYDVGVIWESMYNNTNIMFSNDNTQLNAMLRYYWARKAEVVAQNYINETTFPTDKVLEQSAILSEYLNYTNAKADSLDNLLGSLNDFTDSTLVNFETLDVIATTKETDQTPYSLKDQQYLSVYWYGTPFGIGGTDTPITDSTGTWYFDNLLYSVWSKQPIVFCFGIGQGMNMTVKISIYDWNNTEVYTALTPKYEGVAGAEYVVVRTLPCTDLSTNLTHATRYTMNITAIKQGNFLTSMKMQTYIPMYFVPSDNTENEGRTLAVCSSKSGKLTTANADHSVDAPIIDKLQWKNSTTVQETTTFTPVTNLKAVYQTLTSRMDLALTSAKSYWSYLRALGYTDVNDVPPNFIIPTPSMVYIDSDVTEKLDYRQLNALYYAYMRGYAELVTSENYREVNVTANDIKLSDLTIVFNCSAYNQYGNETYWTTKYAFLMPTTETLKLELGNNTLTQTVRTFVFDNWTDVTGTMCDLKTNEIVEIYDVYKEGAWWNVTSVDIGIKTLGQIAFTYDFTLKGDPTYTRVSPYDLSTILGLMIPLMVIMAILGMFTKKRNSNRSTTSRKRKKR